VLLALDARNSGIVAGFRDGDAWKAVVRLGVDRSADEIGILLEAAAARAGIGSGTATASVDEAWLSSVVPALTPRLVHAVREAFGIDASTVGPGTRTGLKIRTDNPAELGSDIVCSCVAARCVAARCVAARCATSRDAEHSEAKHSEAKTPAVIVVDFEAALVVSAVNADGELLGASIAPGLETAARSLRASAAQIPEIRLDVPRRAIGKNTAQSLQSGIVFGYGGLVSRLVELMSAEMGGSAEVFGTGDDTGRTVLEREGYTRFVPNLALEGLALLAELNRGTAKR
jgi:type III pantothenate kinase